jgi:hypothetical protein
MTATRKTAESIGGDQDTVTGISRRVGNATGLPPACSSRPQASGLTLQNVRNSQSVRKIVNVYAGPNTLTL